MSGFTLINVGAAANDGNGDSLRVSQQAVNSNYTSTPRALGAVADLANEAAASGYARIVQDSERGGIFKAVNGGTVDNGIIFASATVGWTWQRVLGESINIDWWPVAADGDTYKTDDSPYFNLAFAAMVVNGIKRLDLGFSKNYIIDGITITSDTLIDISMNGSTLTQKISGGIPTNHGLIFRGCTNVWLQSGYLSQQITDQAALSRSWTTGVDDYSCVKALGGDQLTFFNVNFKDSYKAGISFDSTNATYGEATDCKVLSCRFNNVYMGVEGVGKWAPNDLDPWILSKRVKEISITSSSFYDAYTEAIDINQPSENVIISNNLFSGVYTQGSFSYAENIDVSFCDKINISSNIFNCKNKADTAISLKEGVRNATISNNVIDSLRSAPNGLTWATSTAYTASQVVNDGVDAYLVQGNYTSGASVQADVLNGDLVELVIGAAFLLSSVQTLSITGNVVEGCRNGVIWDSNGPGDGVIVNNYDNIISSNVFKNVRKHGFWQIGKSRNEAVINDYRPLKGLKIIGNNLTCRPLNGTADGGTTTTLILEEPQGSTGQLMFPRYDDYLNGCTIKILSGTNSGAERVISDYSVNTVTGAATVTVSQAYSSAIDNTSEYQILFGQGYGVRLLDLEDCEIQDNRFAFFEIGGHLLGQTEQADFADVTFSGNRAIRCRTSGFALDTGTRIDSNNNTSLFCGTSSIGNVRPLYSAPTVAGTGYSVAYNIPTTTDGSGSGLTVDVVSVSSGVVLLFKVRYMGRGYASGDIITIGAGNSDATYTLTDDDVGSFGFVASNISYSQVISNAYRYNEIVGAYFRTVTQTQIKHNNARGGDGGSSTQQVGFKSDSDCGNLDVAENYSRAHTVSDFDWDGTSITDSYTIASGVITIDSDNNIVYAKLDTEGAAATDDLDTINGGFRGQILVLSSTDSGRDIVLKDATGNMRLTGDLTIGDVNDIATLIRAETVWREISFANN